MTFFEQELRKIVSDKYPNASFVGRACYVRLDEMNRVKIQFVTMGIANHYEALRLTVLNRQEGDVDNLLIRFSDLLGSTNNKASPHIWDDHGETDWYCYHPTKQDYLALTDAVSDYPQIFQEQVQTEYEWEQSM